MKKIANLRLLYSTIGLPIWEYIGESILSSNQCMVSVSRLYPWGSIQLLSKIKINSTYSFKKDYAITILPWSFYFSFQCICLK